MSNEYQPKTGRKCSCKRGVQRDNCPNCEGTGWVIDFAAIRARASKSTAKTFPLYNVIRWPDANGEWWLVSEASATRGYTAIRELHPLRNMTSPAYNNQLWAAAKLLADKGPDALVNPHAMIGRTCGCRECFCCAADEIYQAVKP